MNPDIRISHGRDSNGNTSLHVALVTNQPEDVLRALVHYFHVDVNGQNFEGRTALHLATLSRAIDKIEWLLRHGANVNARDLEGATPLHYAAAFDDVAAIKLLVGFGAHLNAQDDDGDCPLIWAVRDGQRAAIQLLIQSGADVYARNDDAEDSLSVASSCGDIDMVRFLWKARGMPENGTNAVAAWETTSAEEFCKKTEELGGILVQHLARGASVIS